MRSALELTQALIARRSLTPEDAGCQELLAARLAAADFRCEPLNAGGVTNLWAQRGSGHPLLCFAGHTDVVPTGPLEQWNSDPFVPTIRDGRLFGRGAADMKSSIAAFVVAVEAFVAERPAHSGSIALLLTSDEEGPAVDGTVRVVETLKQRNELIDYCIVGEPTSVDWLGDMLKNGRRGSLSGQLTVRGVQGHVAYPSLVKNPVHLLAPALAELVRTEWDKGNDSFPPTSFQVSNIHAGTGAANVVPGSVVVDFNFRFSTESTPAALQARVREVLGRHGLDYSIDWTLGGNPFLTRRGRLVETLSAVVARVTGVTPEVNCTGGTSDGRFIAEICPEVAEFGPVNRTIHKVDEAVAVSEIEPLARIYRETVEALLAG